MLEEPHPRQLLGSLGDAAAARLGRWCGHLEVGRERSSAGAALGRRLRRGRPERPAACGGARRRRGRHRRRPSRRLLDRDLGLDRALEVVGGAAELGQSLADRAADLGQPLGAEDQQRQDEDEEDFGEAEGSEHVAPRTGIFGRRAARRRRSRVLGSPDATLLATRRARAPRSPRSSAARLAGDRLLALSDDTRDGLELYTELVDAAQRELRRRGRPTATSSTPRSTACCGRSTRTPASSRPRPTRRCARSSRPASTASASWSACATDSSP